jgi:hypothetical protein
VTIHRELEGLEAVYVFDQEERPEDSGTSGTTYTADIYVVHDNGAVEGPYSGSSYPNSVSNSDNSPAFNTVDEGMHNYSNEFGHDGGAKQGLNLGQGDVNTHEDRKVPGTTPEGDVTDVEYANVHKGTSDNGNYNSRGSQACITVKPSDSPGFFSNFDWSGSYNGFTGNTGNSKGTISIYRGGSNASNAAKSMIDFRRSDAFNSLVNPTAQSDATNFSVPIVIIQ